MATAPPARNRILDTATRLFYAEGVRAVGVDRIIAEAGVAKATFYNHFPRKDDLVRAYVEDQSLVQQGTLRSLDDAGTDPLGAIRDHFEYLGDAGASSAYRGCPIINVAIEYPDATTDVRQAVDQHRRWFREQFRRLLEGGGHARAAAGAEMLVLLRDGLLVGLDLDDAAAVRSVIRDAVGRVLDVDYG